MKTLVPTCSLKALSTFGIFIVVIFSVIYSQWSLHRDSSPTETFKASYVSTEIGKRWTIEGGCFLQGFLRLNNSVAIASCGGYGRSHLSLISGLVDDHLDIRKVYDAPTNYFLEGCTLVGENRLLVLTWRERKILEFSVPSFELVREVIYPFEGWGMTYDAARHVLWTSDGTNILRVVDPQTLSVVRECEVFLSHDGASRLAVAYINELEYADGLIYANIYMEASVVDSLPNYIVGIDPDTCLVERIIPLFGIGKRNSPGSVMNGIAVGFEPNALLISGKNWDSVYEVKIGHVTTNILPEWSRFNITRFVSAKLKFR